MSVTSKAVFQTFVLDSIWNQTILHPHRKCGYLPTKLGWRVMMVITAKQSGRIENLVHRCLFGKTFRTFLSAWTCCRHHQCSWCWCHKCFHLHSTSGDVGRYKTNSSVSSLLRDSFVMLGLVNAHNEAWGDSRYDNWSENLLNESFEGYCLGWWAENVIPPWC